MSKYQSYPEYKNSGVEWIGAYPTEWNLTCVKFESYVKARVGWHGLKSDDFTYEGPYLVTGSDFKGPIIDWKECYHCDLERYEQDPYIQLKEGDLLITKDGTIGKIALVKNLNGKATLNSGVFVVRPLERNYTSQFYFWLLQSSVFTSFVDFNKTGSTIVHLYQDTFVNFKYAMPSMEEQQKIANFLDHETAKIDTLIEKQQQLIKLLKEKRQAVISHAVTKGLNPKAPMRDSGVEWLGEVPEHWEIKKAKHVFVLQRGRDLSSEQFVKGEYPVYGSNGVIGYHNEYTTKGPSLTVGRSGSVGEINYIEEDFWAHNTSLYVKEIKDVNIRFVYYMLLAMDVKSLSAGSAVGTLDRNNIHARYVALPNIIEQENTVKYLNDILMEFIVLIEKSNQTILLLKERRTALISAAVTGKIDVRKWQPAKP